MYGSMGCGQHLRKTGLSIGRGPYCRCRELEHFNVEQRPMLIHGCQCHEFVRLEVRQPRPFINVFFSIKLKVPRYPSA